MSRPDDGEPAELKQCPFCAEDIKRDAIKCKHCESMLNGSVLERNAPSSKRTALNLSSADALGLGCLAMALITLLPCLLYVVTLPAALILGLLGWAKGNRRFSGAGLTIVLLWVLIVGIGTWIHNLQNTP